MVMSRPQSNHLLSLRRRDFKMKNGRLTQQLKSVHVNLPVVQLHLILCSIFAARANKHEFLGLSQYLIDRLAMLARAVFPLK